MKTYLVHGVEGDCKWTDIEKTFWTLYIRASGQQAPEMSMELSNEKLQ